MLTRLFLLLTLSMVVLVAPASGASGMAQVPEGSSLTLFALGLAGLILGRRFAMRKGDDGEGQD